MKLSYLSFLVIFVGLLFFGGCVTQHDARNTTTTSATVAATSTTIMAAQADVSISSFTCSLTLIDESGVKSDQVRAIVQGKAQGPVGARLELPILIWSTAEWDCGAWSQQNGALVTVGHTCVRREGQPDSMNWSVTAAGKVTRGSMRGSRSYGAKIYLDNDIMPQKEDSSDTACQ